MKNLKEGFSIIKQGIAVHGEFASNYKDYFMEMFFGTIITVLFMMMTQQGQMQ